MAKLTAKQAAFIDEYLIDLNATQAAIRAGYSEKRASEIGYQLLRKTTVSGVIAERMKEREKKAIITAEEIINGLKAIAVDAETRNSDKIKAFELLGKHMALFTDKVQHEGKQELEVVVMPKDES